MIILQQNKYKIVNMSKKGKYEVERKFLLKEIPKIDDFFYNLLIDIEHFYLEDGRRLSKSLFFNIKADKSFNLYKKEFISTIKTPIQYKSTAHVNIEEDTELSETEFIKIINKSKNIKKIKKQRYQRNLPDGTYWEIDNFLNIKLIIAEFELMLNDESEFNEIENIEIPLWLKPHIITEVSGNSAFSNYNLAI